VTLLAFLPRDRSKLKTIGVRKALAIMDYWRHVCQQYVSGNPLPAMRYMQSLQSNRHITSANNGLGLFELPPELLNDIISRLDKNSLKSLRATCLTLDEIVPLIDRVFISANTCNLNIVCKIAGSEVLRDHVTEIIWDDARLSTGPECDFEMERFWCGHPNDIMTDNGCPRWFKERRLNDYVVGEDEYERNHYYSDEAIHLRQSWDYYEELLEGQSDIPEQNGDIETSSMP
jgi:hypothetical protein